MDRVMLNRHTSYQILRCGYIVFFKFLIIVAQLFLLCH